MNQINTDTIRLRDDDLDQVAAGYDKCVGWRQMRRAAETCRGDCSDGSTSTMRGSSGSW